ncbi:DUF397 domain-containing protein [Streptomyces sp. ET3-23]|uniref:DUF397 domain-containing protein n=1 Tax=Streptomyces sp. ET3-23 TaxID=2885643 RepID=UPI001D10FC62|nr:DUF397 domain-containing protein [Streptomyces sp. ET3-23]MCC2279371.1 DUF397 domain-containing protein [Streptomyces sp. ET3-23]
MQSARDVLSNASWRKSTYSDTGAECVEVAEHIPGWRKSTYSSGQEDCLEVADSVAAIAVRDSKRAPSGPALILPRQAWARFIRTL